MAFIGTEDTYDAQTSHMQNTNTDKIQFWFKFKLSSDNSDSINMHALTNTFTEFIKFQNIK